MQNQSSYQKFRIWAAGLKGPWRYHLAQLGGSPDAYLKLCRGGVVHVGGSRGEESALYAQNKLKVVWIEPNPESFAVLRCAIEDHPDQIALNYLIADRDDEKHTLHISNNYGMSSSIFDLHHHKDIWPEIHYVGTIEMSSRTLSTVLRESNVQIAEYEVLVMDTQGAELLVLKGAAEILSNFKFIKAEAADFEAYKGCCTSDQIIAFLEPYGFRLLQKDIFAKRRSGGAYFELLFRRD
jgi:FkbM family methyltransferase